MLKKLPFSDIRIAQTHSTVKANIFRRPVFVPASVPDGQRRPFAADKCCCPKKAEFIYKRSLRQSLMKQQLVCVHWPFDLPKQAV